MVRQMHEQKEETDSEIYQQVDTEMDEKQTHRWKDREMKKQTHRWKD